MHETREGCVRGKVYNSRNFKQQHWFDVRMQTEEAIILQAVFGALDVSLQSPIPCE